MENHIILKFKIENHNLEIQFVAENFQIVFGNLSIFTLV
jgi:hypothetical protein